jgi:hypothetical protein
MMAVFCAQLEIGGLLHKVPTFRIEIPFLRAFMPKSDMMRQQKFCQCRWGSLLTGLRILDPLDWASHPKCYFFGDLKLCENNPRTPPSGRKVCGTEENNPNNGHFVH